MALSPANDGMERPAIELHDFGHERDAGRIKNMCDHHFYFYVSNTFSNQKCTVQEEAIQEEQPALSQPQPEENIVEARLPAPLLPPLPSQAAGRSEVSSTICIICEDAARQTGELPQKYITLNCFHNIAVLCSVLGVWASRCMPRMCRAHNGNFVKWKMSYL